jgi:hypothetical protein
MKSWGCERFLSVAERLGEAFFRLIPLIPSPHGEGTVLKTFAKLFVLPHQQLNFTVHISNPPILILLFEK